VLHLESNRPIDAIYFDVEYCSGRKNNFLFCCEASILGRARNVVLLPLMLVTLPDGNHMGLEVTPNSTRVVTYNPTGLIVAALEIHPGVVHASVGGIAHLSKPWIRIVLSAFEDAGRAVLINFINDRLASGFNERPTDADVSPGGDVSGTDCHQVIASEVSSGSVAAATWWMRTSVGAAPVGEGGTRSRSDSLWLWAIRLLRRQETGNRARVA
jgi:hypothetical protein